MKKCFIITPIGDEGSATRRDTDRLIRVVIRPVLEELGFEATAAPGATGRLPASADRGYGIDQNSNPWTVGRSSPRHRRSSK